MVTIGTRLSVSGAVCALARDLSPFAKIWCTLGTHPDHVDNEPQTTAAAIAGLTSSSEVVGIGESGLDYVASTTDPVAQRESFNTHIRAAQMTGLPLVIHARGADNDIARMLSDEYKRAPFGFVLHCFTSGVDMAKIATDLGGYISFSGILTFPKADEIRAVAGTVPRDRLLVETDSPFLAPVPKRGRRNEPSLLPHTASMLATIIGCSVSEVADLTTQNFRRLFSRTA